MVRGNDATCYQVRLSVPRNGGWRAWGVVSGDFERRLAGQRGPEVIDAHVESQTRRGRDYVRVTIALTVDAPDVARALTAAWSAFVEAASDDPAGWEMASGTAEVGPGIA